MVRNLGIEDEQEAAAREGATPAPAGAGRPAGGRRARARARRPVARLPRRGRGPVARRPTGRRRREAEEVAQPPARKATLMGALVWVMMGLALWHFTIFIPDRFWSGIVGAFLGAVLGALLFGLIINGFAVPGQNDTDLLTALEAMPGALIGIAAVYFYGASRGEEPV